MPCRHLGMAENVGPACLGGVCCDASITSRDSSEGGAMWSMDLSTLSPSPGPQASLTPLGSNIRGCSRLGQSPSALTSCLVCVLQLNCNVLPECGSQKVRVFPEELPLPSRLFHLFLGTDAASVQGFTELTLTDRQRWQEFFNHTHQQWSSEHSAGTEVSAAGLRADAVRAGGLGSPWAGERGSTCAQ